MPENQRDRYIIDAQVMQVGCESTAEACHPYHRGECSLALVLAGSLGERRVGFPEVTG